MIASDAAWDTNCSAATEERDGHNTDKVFEYNVQADLQGEPISLQAGGSFSKQLKLVGGSSFEWK